MTEAPEDEETPLHDGPDPRDWERNSLLSMAAEDVRAADAMLDLLRGTRPRPEMTRGYTEALVFLESVTVQAREVLALQLLNAYKIALPEEPAGPPTEAVGGFSGDSDGPGDRDHLRRVRE